MKSKYGSLVPQGVTCLSPSIDCNFLLTGGFDCEIKLWQIGRQTQTLINSQRVHKAPITNVQYIGAGEQSITADIAGCIIVWDMRQVRGSKPLQKVSQMDSPPTRGADGIITTGILRMCYNEDKR